MTMPGREVLDWDDPDPSPTPASRDGVKNRVQCDRCRKSHGLATVYHAAGFRHAYRPMPSLQERRGRRIRRASGAKSRADLDAHAADLRGLGVDVQAADLRSPRSSETRAAIAAFKANLPVACDLNLGVKGNTGQARLIIRSPVQWDRKRLKPLKPTLPLPSTPTE